MPRTATKTIDGRGAGEAGPGVTAIAVACDAAVTTDGTDELPARSPVRCEGTRRPGTTTRRRPPATSSVAVMAARTGYSDRGPRLRRTTRTTYLVDQSGSAIFYELADGIHGLLHESEYRERPTLGSALQVRIAAVDRVNRPGFDGGSEVMLKPATRSSFGRGAMVAPSDTPSHLTPWSRQPAERSPSASLRRGQR
jgi:hypothetical protein